ncbi:hypothetical protein AB6A68_14590, partial [Ferrimicrobium acidiphilum]
GFDDEPSADEFADCDALLTRGAMPPDPDSSHEGVTLRAALFSRRGWDLGTLSVGRVPELRRRR